MSLGNLFQISDADDMFFERTSITRLFWLSDDITGYLTGYADGSSDGLRRGMQLIPEPDDDPDAGTPGFGQGMVVGARAVDVDAVLEEGRRDGLAMGTVIGVRSVDVDALVDEGRSYGLSLGLAMGSGDAAAETDPPELSVVSPDPDEAPGDPGAFPAPYATAKDTPIAIVVADDVSDVAFVVISVRFTDPAAADGFTNPGTVYAGRPADDGVAGYQPGYAAFSAVTGTGAPGVGVRFDVRADTGWPGQLFVNSVIRFDTKAVDSKGNVLP